MAHRILTTHGATRSARSKLVPSGFEMTWPELAIITVTFRFVCLNDCHDVRLGDCIDALFLRSISVSFKRPFAPRWHFHGICLQKLCEFRTPLSAIFARGSGMPFLATMVAVILRPGFPCPSGWGLTAGSLALAFALGALDGRDNSRNQFGRDGICVIRRN